jgi:F-type H+-transporting ATPase subunit gamma
VELGLIACLKDIDTASASVEPSPATHRTGVVVFGSDQGMVGQFNEAIADFIVSELKSIPGQKLIWPVGERIAWRLTGFDIDLMPLHSVPDTVAGITLLTAALLEEIQQRRKSRTVTQVLVFHNQPLGGKGYRPSRQRLLPFDGEWLRELAARKWPTKMIPQVMPVETETFAALLREYLFVSLFRACAESLASENGSRLASMQAAERKIGDLIEQLRLQFNQARQNSIDEELFDVITGYEALSHAK